MDQKKASLQQAISILKARGVSSVQYKHLKPEQIIKMAGLKDKE